MSIVSLARAAARRRKATPIENCKGGSPVGGLAELQQVTAWRDELTARREELINACIDAGHSERAIGRAAGISGPAIHQRKRWARP